MQISSCAHLRESCDMLPYGPSRFGPSRAPSNWDMVATFPQFIPGKLPRRWVGIYADYCFLVGPKESVFEAYNIFTRVCGLLGVGISHRKCIGPLGKHQLLGAEIEIAENIATSSHPYNKRLEYCDMMTHRSSR